MSEAREMILEDAIQTAIENEKKNVVLQKIVTFLFIVNVLLFGILVGKLL